MGVGPWGATTWRAMGGRAAGVGGPYGIPPDPR